MRKLSTLDLAFFLAETDGSPKHVAGLTLYKKPKSAPANFCRKLIAELKSYDNPTEPFNLVIRLVGLQGPHWEDCEDFDIDEHVFYHEPKKNISWLEAKNFAARLHEPVLDRARPLWEFHLIDGIEGRQFAVYTKLHHAYADGVTMAGWIERSLAKSPDDMKLRPPWALPQKRRKKHIPNKAGLTSTVSTLTSQAWNQVLTSGGIAKLATQQVLERMGITHHAVSVPFSAQRDTPLTGDTKAGRNIATTCIPMERMRAVCKATRATLNHVALTAIDGGLHRYLEETGNGINHPITIQMPINLRADGSDRTGNNLGVALVELAQPTDDTYKRLQEIGHSLQNVKNQIKSVRGDSIEQYTIMLALTGELIDKLKLSNRLPANGHTLVSNLPGPPEALYLKGAKVEQYCPLSLLLPGLRTNITLFSCSGILNIGIVSTRDLVELDRLAVAIEDEFQRLYATVL